MGVRHSLLYLVHHLVPKLAQGLPHVPALLLDNLAQNWRQLHQCSVVGILVPRLNENAIVRLLAEVGSQVVHYYRLGEGAPDSTQIFAEDLARVRGVLPVQPVRDPLVWVELVQHPVGVVLHRGREYDQLIELGHFLQECFAARPHSEIAFAFAVLVVVDQSLIQV